MWDIRQEELHAQEMPICVNTSLLANVNRDPSHSKKPWDPLDFSIYAPRESGDSPSVMAAAAYMSLASTHQLPTWALFCFADFKQGANVQPPMLVAFVCEDAVLLAPVESDVTFSGLLIAMESASNSVRTMRSPCGRSVSLRIPEIRTKVIAEQGAVLGKA